MSATPLACAALAAALAATAPPAPPEGPPPETLSVAGIGEVGVVAPAGAAARTVLLLSGDPADPGSRRLAAALAADGALVAVVDVRPFLASLPTGRCAYPAGDLEELAQRVEKVRGVAAYQRPVLAGHRQGAAVAWAALSQAPPGTFAGLVSVAPCAGTPLPVRLCKGSGPAPRPLPGGELPALAPPPGPVELIAGARDEACPARASAALARALGARYTEVPGAGPALEGATIDAARAAASRVAAPRAEVRAPPAPAVSDLPLVEVPSARPGTRLVVLLTGDGGWVGVDEALAAAFAEAGVSVVGLDSLRYFWKRRTPQEAAADVARIMDHYRAAWGRPDVLLVGYSRGADVVPLLAGILPAAERAHLRLVAMLGPSTFAELEVHAIDLFSSKRRAAAIPTEPAVRATGGAVPMLCVHGTGERDSLCPKLADLPWVKDVLREGGHRLHGGDASGLVREVLEAAP